MVVEVGRSGWGWRRRVVDVRVGGGLIGRWRHGGGCEKRDHVRSLSNGRHPQSTTPFSPLSPPLSVTPYPPPRVTRLSLSSLPPYHHAPNPYTRRTELWLRATCIYYMYVRTVRMYMYLHIYVCTSVYRALYVPGDTGFSYVRG